MPRESEVSDNQPTHAGLMAGFDSWQHWLRFTITALLAVTCIALSVIGILQAIDAQRSIRVDSYNGGISLSISGKMPTRIYQVHASQIWHNTGVRVEPNESVAVFASGAVNLSVNQLVERVIRDDRPLHPWTGPEGYSHGVIAADDLEWLIHPSSPQGALVGALVEDGAPEPGIPSEALPCRHHTPSTKFIGRESELLNNGSRTATLWLCVNDLALSPNAKDTYSKGRNPTQTADGHPSSTTDRRKISSAFEAAWRLPKDWEHINSQQYWDAWFDDNLGSFQVIVLPPGNPN